MLRGVSYRRTVSAGLVRVAAMAGALAAGVLSGCSSPPPAAGTLGVEPALKASPVVLGGDNGLEMQYWVTSGEGFSLAAALGAFREAPVPIDPEVRSLLEQNGLRVFAVPVDQLESVRTSLPVVGSVQRQWLGQAAEWIDTAAGPVRERGQMIAVHDGPLRVGPGRLRLLVRCWTVPVPPGNGGKEAALHLEVVPQHQEHSPRGDLSLTPQRLAPADEGLLFSRLHLTTRLDGAVALVIVPEAPHVDWDKMEAPSVAPAEQAPSAAQSPRQAAPGLGQVSRVDPGALDVPPPPSGGAPAAASPLAGPPSATLPTLGEAMLLSRSETAPSSGRAEPTVRTLRAVVVLVPRVPDRFELLGR